MEVSDQDATAHPNSLSNCSGCEGVEFPRSPRHRTLSVSPFRMARRIVAAHSRLPRGRHRDHHVTGNLASSARKDRDVYRACLPVGADFIRAANTHH